MDEIRKSYQEELDKLRQLLKKARVSPDQAASEEVMGNSTLEIKGRHEGFRKVSSFFFILYDDISHSQCSGRMQSRYRGGQK